MDWDEIEPLKRPVERKNLDVMGVAELEAYVADLEAEIGRARTAIAAKLSVRAGADSLFKK